MLSSSVIWKPAPGQESRRDFQCRDGLEEFNLPVGVATDPSVGKLKIKMTFTFLHPSVMASPEDDKVVGQCSQSPELIPV